MSRLHNMQNKNSYSPPVFTDSNRLAKIQKLFPLIDKMYQDYAKKNHFPGYAYGIMLDAKLIHSGYFGYANLSQKTPVHSQSMFRIASMSKSFTAMAVLKLRDQGKLRLDDLVKQYIPEFKHQQLTWDEPEITIRDLLIQTLGLPQDDPWADRNLHQTDQELIAFLEQGISFSNVPGICYEYSNLAYAMLGYIIKQVAGVSYQQFIAENIWQPLNMQHAEWEFRNISPAQLVQGYRWTNGNWLEEELLQDGSFGAMGGIICSVESFSKYVAMHQLAWPPRDETETSPLKRSSLREMHQPWRFYALDAHQDPKVTAYGYGLRWLKNSAGQVYIGHSGGLPGFGSNWFFMPDYGIAVILLSNVTYGNAAEINLQVLNRMINEAQLSPRSLPVSAVLNARKNALIKLLPDWKEIEENVFAENFFLDTPVDELKQQTTTVFEKIGKVIRISDLQPENQLRGSFMIEGDLATAKLSFTLSPQNPALIQKFFIE